MLHAAAKRKLRTTKWYEDEVTSSIFGPLSYLPAEQVWDFFGKLVPAKGLWPIIVPNRHTFDFWVKTGEVQPDLIVRFFQEDMHILTLLIEIKWNSSLFPENQLVRQWSSIPQTEKPHCLHLYLVKNFSKGEREVARSLDQITSSSRRKRWEERLFCIGWRNFAETLRDNAPVWEPTIIASWAGHTKMFLEHIGVNIFIGFSSLPDLHIQSVVMPFIFWKELLWFSNLRKGVMQGQVVKGRPIFWQEQ